MTVLLIVAVALLGSTSWLISRRQARHSRSRQTAWLRVAELERENHSLRAELHRRARIIDELRTRVRRQA